MDRETIRESVLELWRELLELDDLDESADFVALGGDSLLSIEMLLRLESMFPDTDFEEISNFDWLTVSGIVEHIHGQ